MRASARPAARRSPLNRITLRNARSSPSSSPTWPGSTALGERLDPELLRRVMWRYFEAVQAVLERHGGTVEKFIGDAVMAVFGVPAVREDDALRAVRAASEIGDALAALNDELSREHGVEIVTRTGINTGEVIVGGGRRRPEARDRRRRQRRGPARAGCRARRGPARRGHATRPSRRSSSPSRGARRRRRARASRSPPAGSSGCGRTCPRSRGRSPTPFVGRRDELEELRAAFDDAVREPLLHARHDRRHARDREVAPRARAARTRSRRRRGSSSAAASRTARASPTSRSRTSCATCRRTRSRPRAPRRRRARRRRGAAVAGAVGEHDERRVARRDGLGVPAALRDARRKRPLVVVVDDIHWADPALLDLARVRARLLERRADPPPLPRAPRPLRRPAVLGGAAPGVRRSSRSSRSATTTRTSSSRGLLREHDLAGRLRERIVATAEGNPLFVEQMLAHALRRPRRRRGRRAADDPGAARRAHRPARARGARRVQRGSVEGRLFHRGAVSALLQDGAGLGGTLLALSAQGVRAPRPLALPRRRRLPLQPRADPRRRLRDRCRRSSRSRCMRGSPTGSSAARRHAARGHEEIVGYHLEQAYR